MPNRIIKESICSSDDIDQLTAFAETVFYRLIVNADDYGRIDARTSFLSHKLFVTKKGITDKNIEEAVAQLASVGLVRLYEVDGRPFLLFPKWHLHQRVRNSRAKYPAPPQLAANCGENPQDAEEGGYNPIQSESNPDLNPNLHVAPERREETQPIAPAFDEDTDAFKLSAHLRGRIRENDPKAKVPNATPSALSRWSKDMDLLLRVDGREPEEVRRIIDWCQTDSFWRGCVLCPATLRKQFTKLLMRASAPARASPFSGSYRRPDQDQEVMTDEQRRALEEKFGTSASGVTGGGDWRAGARA
jgi:hypothetical protein